MLSMTAILIVSASALAAPQQAPFHASVEPLSLPSGAEGAVTLRIEVPAGGMIYQDQVAVEVVHPGGLTVSAPDLPPSLKKVDPFSGIERQVYTMDVYVEVPVTAPAQPGDYELLLESRWQGCHGGICYNLQEEVLPATVVVTPKKAAWAEGLLSLLPAAEAAEEGKEKPVTIEVSAEPGSLLVSFDQAEGWHLTQTMTFIELAEGQAVQLGEQDWPEAHQRPDPAFPGQTRGEFDGDFTVSSTLYGPAGEHQVKGTVGYQACKAEICLLPQYHDFEITLEVLEGMTAPPAAEPEVEEAPAQAAAAPSATAEPSAAAASSAAPAVPDSSGGFAAAQEKGLFWLLLFVFGAGFLVSLTPCVLPMIPITIGIIGAGSEGDRLKGFLLSLTYVAGMAMVYTGLGVFAAMSGSLFGGWMQSIWVVGAVAAFFALMGFSMFGFFDVAVPSSIQSKLSDKGGAGFGGAFVVGMVGGVVAGPCSGPVIASLMVLIGQQGALALGASLMLAFSLGIGVLFIIAGTFSGFIFQPGMWMENIKKGFGILLWLGAIYYIEPHLSDSTTALLTASVLLVTGIFGWPERESMEGHTMTRLRMLYGVLAGLVGGYLLLGVLLTRGFILPPLQLSSGSGAATAAPSSPAWMSQEEEALALAQEQNLPLIIDFTAEWCAACKELEHYTYTDARVIERSKSFIPVMLDMTTDDDPVVSALRTKYGVTGLPTVKFLRPDGTALEDLTLTGFEDADAFLARMDSALERMK